MSNVPVLIQPALERAHSMRDDLDWLPRSFQYVRWGIAGAVWTTLGAATVALLASTHVSFIYFGKGGWGLVAGGYWAGERAARSLLRRRLARLAGGEVDLIKLRQTDDGELVAVRGKIRALGTLPAPPGEPPSVYRRRHIRLDALEFVQEQAVDFQIVSEDGQKATVRVEHSRFVADPPKSNRMARMTVQEVEQLSTVYLGKGAFRSLAQARKRLMAGKKAAATTASVLLRDGDEVSIVGYKSRAVDPTVSDRLGRDIPYATVLQGGSELPLIVTVAGPRALAPVAPVDALAASAPKALPPATAPGAADDAS